MNSRIFVLTCLAVLLPAVADARQIHYGAVISPAVVACDKLSWQGQREAATDCYEALLVKARSSADRAEAAWALGDPQTANLEFRRALRETPGDVRALVRWGDLYAASHQHAEAMNIYREALDRAPDDRYARLGAASVLAAGFEQAANGYLAPLLDGSGDGAETAALLLAARIALENGDPGRAGQLLDRGHALVDAQGWPPLDVYALEAAADILRDEDGSAWVEQALAYNAGYGRIYSIPAHFLVVTRRYAEAVALYERAVEVEPALAEAHEQLGINLLRVNAVDRAREHLEIAYELDPFSPVTVNTLRLLDSFSEFRLVEDTAGDVPIVLRLREDEADALAPYAITLIRDSIAEFSVRYDYEPDGPVVVEMYPDHDDFAVRTAGMPGLGILGAAFGNVVAMDSPSGRSADEFQWGTTLWHEMAHVFTLGATDHLVPRWFSEGVSVFEEWQSGPNPGVRIPLGVLESIRDGRMLPVADLDEGFIRPTYEGQVLVSYMQAGLVCRYIEAQYGEDALSEMLVAYRDGLDTAAAVREVLGVDAGAFDGAFSDAIEREFGKRLDGLDAWRESQSQLRAALDAEDWDEVESLAVAQAGRMPEYVAGDSPYLALARAHRARGDDAAAIDVLTTWWRRGGYSPAALGQLGALLREAGRHDEAIAVYRSINLVDPFDEAVHGVLGDLLLAADRPAEALVEYRVALALEPHDRATAYFRIADAQARLGEADVARYNLLKALDVAPGYRPAQKLLLELTESQ